MTALRIRLLFAFCAIAMGGVLYLRNQSYSDRDDSVASTLRTNNNYNNSNKNPVIQLMKEGESKFASTTPNETFESSSRYTKEALADEITNLPGLDWKPNFRQFSGYLTVDEDTGRNIFYWYVESQNDPENDPVVYWSNGGPGCSGMLGFGAEHGPYHIGSDGTLSPNPYSWNKVASMFYVEQPAGVGFSYADDPKGYETDDAQAARDNYMLVKAFLKKFPERQSNEFYLSSESYGGHYIPQLTLEIMNGNADGAINFRGFLLGNPYVDPFSNQVAAYEKFYQNGLLSKPTFDKWKKSCGISLDTYDQKHCDDYEEAMLDEIGDDINPYALDYPVCTDDDNDGDDKLSFSMDPLMTQEGRLMDLISPIMAMKKMTYNSPPFVPKKDKYQPCSSEYLHRYLNRQDVKTALHVKGSGAWNQCTSYDILHYNLADKDVSMIPLYKEIIQRAMSDNIALNLMIFSGDDDSVCSTASTQYWLYDLGVKPTKGGLWKRWEIDGQTSGFVTDFDLGDHTKSSFRFATVHGAGHEVPAYRPVEALHLFKSYFSDKW